MQTRMMLALTLLIFPILLTGCPHGQNDEPGTRSKAYADCLSRQTQTGENCSNHQSP
jgi:hypothetical protein